jgi:hypothetical protein
MNVKRLKELLNEVPEDATVMVHSSGQMWSGAERLVKRTDDLSSAVYLAAYGQLDGPGLSHLATVETRAERTARIERERVTADERAAEDARSRNIWRTSSANGRAVHKVCDMDDEHLKNAAFLVLNWEKRFGSKPSLERQAMGRNVRDEIVRRGLLSGKLDCGGCS